jgi:Protein of unknown function (DUF4230)
MSSLERFRERTGTTEPTEELATQARPAAAAPTERDARGVVVPRAAWAGIVVAVLVLSGAVAVRIVTGGLADLNPFKGGVVTQRTVDRSGPAVLKAVSDLGTLQTASGYYEVVIDVERNIDHVPSFLVGRRVLFVAAGSVDAGVDLRNLPPGAVTVNEAGTAATIRLPAPELSAPRLDLQRSYVYNTERGIVDRIGDALSGSGDDQKELYLLASKRLTQAAAANGELTTRAETNARGVLQGLLRPLGFTEVTVVFDAPTP